MAALYVGAGFNHFLRPRFYLKIIPPYFPQPEILNYASGIAEIVCGLCLLYQVTRVWAAWGIIVMLVLFMVVHVYMLQQATRQPHYMVTPAVAWLRLLLQPVLIAWAFWHTKL
jgi:uncharacterized membrane protein